MAGWTDPKYLSEMQRKSRDNDVVVGSRYIKGGKIEGWEWPRYVNSYGANFVTRLVLGLKPKDATAGFKCYSARFLSSLDLDKIIAGGYAFQVEMAYLAYCLGYQMIEIPIYFADRRWGTSKMSLRIQQEAAIRVWQILFEYRDLVQSP